MTDEERERCAVCGHYRSQHIAPAPRMCADCAREDRPNAFHAFTDRAHGVLESLYDSAPPPPQEET